LTLIGFALYVFANYRSKLLQKITKENIAMDLHDEVGTMLTRVLYLMKLESKESKMVSYLSDALYSLRVYINTMNKSQFGMEQLSDEFKELASNILGEDMVSFNFDKSISQPLEINADLYRDIKLCIYELLNNIQKHAFASAVYFDLTIEDNNIKIRIIDNGCYEIALQKTSNGNGIENIKKRVARNQGFVKFEKNAEGTGLQVSLSIPLK
jgi:signal transduction histidine kinase